MFTPLKHQTEDSEALLEYKYGYLWADPGTGKTFTSLLSVKKGDFKKVVVVCPKIATTMWQEQLDLQLGLKAFVILSSNMPKSVALHKYDALVITFDLVPKLKKLIHEFAYGKENANDNRNDVNSKPNSALIFDEAHYIKTHTAQRTIAALGWRIDGIDGIVHDFDAIWFLTGTPMTRYPDDLWVSLSRGRKEVLQHYGVYSRQAFVNEFCVVQKKQYSRHQAPKLVITGGKNLDKLKRLLDDCKVIRRRLTDVIDNMPPITERVVQVGHKGVANLTMSPARLEAELKNRDSEAAKVRRLLGIAKAPEVAAYCTEYAMLPALIGVFHRSVAEEIKIHLESEGHSVAIINGMTQPKERDQIIKTFNEGGLDFVIGQYRSMGVSANMQDKCSHVILAEELESSGEFDQFIGRVYRNGQKKHVQIDHVRSSHSLDTALVEIRKRKAAISARLDV